MSSSALHLSLCSHFHPPSASDGHLLQTGGSGELCVFLSTDGRAGIKREGHQISDLISSGQTGAVAGTRRAIQSRNTFLQKQEASATMFANCK